MNPIRFGVAGVCGAIGGTHVRAIQSVEGARLVAVADLDQDGARRVAQATGAEATKNYEWMVKRGDIDVVSLCTPHDRHFEQIRDALKSRKHVLVERPLATTVADADKLLKAAEKAERTISVVNQYRHRPAARAAKGLIAQGELGRIYRATLVHTAFKTQHYYDSAPWRGTWEGAGGGAMMHQGLPYLDLIAWLIGSPTRIVAWNRTLAHDIAVDDCCTAMAEYENGAQLMVHFNTFQIPGESYLEIVGDTGTVRIEGNQLHFYRPESPLGGFIATDTSHIYAFPECSERKVEMQRTEGTHAAVVADLVAALRAGRAPSDTPEDALAGLELANAILVSGHTGKPVELPLKRSAIRRVMKQLSQPKKSEAPLSPEHDPAR